MKRIWLLGLAASLFALADSAAWAGNPECFRADELCVDTNNANAGSGNPLVDVTSQLPVQGIVAAGDTGYVFFDGDSGNEDPLDGYLGLNAADAALLSFSDKGNFKRRGGNASPPSPPGGGGAPALPIPLPAGGAPSLPIDGAPSLPIGGAPSLPIGGAPSLPTGGAPPLPVALPLP